ncbi:hypothetical protein IDM40_25575 [Nocardiopsis sp. HNM0947]|uniref:Uncharacterized protein n=1 Tax=Nocardiopsis coralli TaxID=2772213 RepID=A0ABR9PE00_9ACTN|nr:hypothetical protein [Nocardiopsis coralli]MBE3002042.1 hypothetical protein [Nocardiopsis coralli]
MSTPPQSPENTEPSESTESPRSADGPKFWFVALYPLVGGTALMVVGFFALMGMMYDEASFAVLFVLGAAVVIGGAHFWLQWILEGRDEPLPWQFPIVLSTAMVAGIFVTLFPIFMNVELPMPLPLVCLGFSLLGVFVFSVAGEMGADRNRLFFALGAILGAVLLIVGVTLWLDGRKQEESKEALSQDVSDFPHEIAVLDLDGWEPTGMWVDEELGTASIDYEPTDPSPELEGFSLALQSESMEEIAETGWTPLYSLCESDGGDQPCEEHGDIVIADMSSNTQDRFEARTEFTDGGAATLMTVMPTDEDDRQETEFPDIDMVELAEQIRAAEPGEDEEVVEEIFR